MVEGGIAVTVPGARSVVGYHILALDDDDMERATMPELGKALEQVHETSIFALHTIAFFGIALHEASILALHRQNE